MVLFQRQIFEGVAKKRNCGQTVMLFSKCPAQGPDKKETGSLTFSTAIPFQKKLERQLY
jgi:hypothetical protein